MMTQVAKKANGTWFGAQIVQPVRSEQCPAQGMGTAEAPPVLGAVLAPHVKDMERLEHDQGRKQSWGRVWSIRST